MIKKINVFLLCSLSATVVAATPAQLPKTLALPGQPVYQLKTIYCPLAKDLVKNSQTNKWSALGLWKGSDRSLVDKVTQFQGAAWQGINLGQPFCIYKGEPAGTFDVILAYHTFAVTPQQGAWQDMHNKTVFKCFSHDVTQCQFQVRLKPKALTINQQLDQIKPGQNNSLNNQGF